MPHGSPSKAHSKHDSSKVVMPRRACVRAAASRCALLPVLCVLYKCWAVALSSGSLPLRRGQMKTGGKGSRTTARPPGRPARLRSAIWPLDVPDDNISQGDLGPARRPAADGCARANAAPPAAGGPSAALSCKLSSVVRVTQPRDDLQISRGRLSVRTYVRTYVRIHPWRRLASGAALPPAVAVVRGGWGAGPPVGRLKPIRGGRL